MTMHDDSGRPGGADATREGAGSEQTPAEASHPGDDVLAAFVDGAASPEEAAEVERHIAGCASCAADVAAARSLRDALGDVPEVDTPWSEGVEPLVAVATAPAPAVSIRERRGHRIGWRGTAAAAFAAAAVLTGVVVLLGNGSAHKGSSLSAAAPTNGAGGAPTVTQQTLFDLTRSLAASGSQPAEFGPSGEGGASAAATAPGNVHATTRVPPAPSLAPDAVGGIPCARRATAQPVSAVAIYAQTAMFDGKRVWVIGFVSAAGPGHAAHVEVVAVTTDDCAVAFLARQPLSS